MKRQVKKKPRLPGYSVSGDSLAPSSGHSTQRKPVQEVMCGADVLAELPLDHSPSMSTLLSLHPVIESILTGNLSVPNTILSTLHIFT